MNRLHCEGQDLAEKCENYDGVRRCTTFFGCVKLVEGLNHEPEKPTKQDCEQHAEPEQALVFVAELIRSVLGRHVNLVHKAWNLARLVSASNTSIAVKHFKVVHSGALLRKEPICRMVIGVSVLN